MTKLHSISADKIGEFVKTELKKPGDWVIYTVENAQSNTKLPGKLIKEDVINFGGVYAVSYYTELEFDGQDFRRLQGERCYQTFLVKKSELEEKQISIEDLENYNSTGYITELGWDYDQTITAFHTTKEYEKFKSIKIEDNIRFPEQLPVVLEKIAQRENIIQFITTRSNKGAVKSQIPLMFPGKDEKFFHERIYGEGGWNSDKLDKVKEKEEKKEKKKEEKEGNEIKHKVSHFKNIYKEFMQNKAIDDKGYLRLGMLKPVIAVVDACIVEDDIANKKNFENAGLKFIGVNSVDNQHLRVIDKELQLGLNIAEEAYKAPIPTAPSEQAAQVSELKIAGMSDETPSETPIEEEGEKNSQGVDADDLAQALEMAKEEEKKEEANIGEETQLSKKQQEKLVPVQTDSQQLAQKPATQIQEDRKKAVIPKQAKIILWGPADSGKTQLLNQYVHGEFSNQYKATLGTDYKNKVISSKETIQFWEVAGYATRDILPARLYKNAKAFLLCVDLTKDLNEQIKSIYEQIDFDKAPPEIDRSTIFLVGTKLDLLATTEDKAKAEKQLKDFHDEKLGFAGAFVVSAKTGENIDNLFSSVFHQIRSLNNLSMEEGEQKDRLEDKKLSKFNLDPSIVNEAITKDLNDKVDQLEKELETALRNSRISMKADDKAKAVQIIIDPELARVDELKQGAIALSEKIVDYYTQLAEYLNENAKPAKQDLTPEQKEKLSGMLRVIEADANAYKVKAIQLTGKQRLVAFALGFIGAVLGFVAGAVAGFMIGNVVGAAVGATAGATTGALIGAGVGAGLLGAAVSASVSIGSRWYSFYANKKQPVRKAAYEFGQKVEEVARAGFGIQTVR